MAALFGYIGAVFNWLFVTTVGENAHTAAIRTVIDLVTGNPYLMIGVSLMIAGSSIAFLRRLIRST